MSDRPIRLGPGAYRPLGPYCEDRSVALLGVYTCWRAPGHAGRHASIGHDGHVRRVWGRDVHAEKRAKGRGHVDS